MGPELVTETRELDIGQHPHTELHTVTWLLAGEVLHRDSLGSEQVIRARQLNLMTAGEGVTHSEEATGRYRGQLHGVQLWMAQPAIWARAATRWCCQRPTRPGCYCSAGSPSVSQYSWSGTSWLGDLHSTVDPRSRRMEVFSMREVSRQEVQDLMNQGAQLVDVLPTEEFQDDHLPGAINLPLRKIETQARRALDPSRPVVVYCWDSA